MQNEVKTVVDGDQVSLSPLGSPEDVAMPDVKEEAQNTDGE
jgi:hypothetical protein